MSPDKQNDLATKNCQFIQESFDELASRYAGRFIVVANAGAVVESFESGEDARDFRESLQEDLRESAVIFFVDNPAEAYIA